MAQQRHLDRAPIREGLIDIHFEPVPIEGIKAFADKIKNKFGEVSDIWQHAFEIEAGKKKLTKNARTPLGKRFATPKEGPARVIQARTTGFTVSRLEPYADWIELRTIAEEAWGIFVEAAKPTVINRLAVRYINALPLPIAPGEDFSIFLTAAPEVPQGLPQAIGAFLQRVVMLDPLTGNKAIVMQALEEAAVLAGGPNTTIFLDIDAFLLGEEFEAKAPEIWRALDSLRDYKNRIFFEHLTERTVELFI